MSADWRLETCALCDVCRFVAGPSCCTISSITYVPNAVAGTLSIECLAEPVCAHAPVCGARGLA